MNLSALKNINHTACISAINPECVAVASFLANLTPPITPNSLPFYNGPLGIGWSHSYDTALTVNDDGSILLRDGSGARSYYAKSGSNYVSPQGDFSTLVKNGDNSFKITYRDGTAHNFRTD